MILAGRRINDGMGGFVAQKLVKLLIAREVPVRRARVAVLGLTFKENVPDLRNSRVPDILRELASFGIVARVHDPLAEPDAAAHEYGLALGPLERAARARRAGAGGAAPRPISTSARRAGRPAGARRHPDRRQVLLWTRPRCPPASAYWSL